MTRKACIFLLLSTLAAALSAPSAADTGPRGRRVGRSASGISQVSGRRLLTGLGGSIPVIAFAVELEPVSKNDPSDSGILNAPGALPAETGFDAIYPNPTNPFASIRYAVAEPARVRISIYSVSGRLIRTLVDDERAPGVHVDQWDGRNRRGAEVVSGLYFVRMQAGEKVFTRKVIVAR